MELFGGSITGNTIGVDGSSYDSLTIGGDAKVINNTTKNLVLLGKSVISIDKSLTSNAWIGISTVTKPSANANIKIATGATKSELDYAQIFTPDTSEQKYVVTKDEKGNLYMGLHQHSWTYTTGGDDTIKVTCSADGCNLESDFAATYMVTAPTVLTYSGSDKVATVKVSDNATGEEFPDVPKIVYQKQTGGSFEEMEGVPKDAGTYRAEITMGNQSAWVIYAIKEKTVTTPTIEVTTPVTYNGTAQKPTVVVKDGANVILASEYRVSYADNINAGTATVTITDVAGGNYNVSGSTKFTIDKGTYPGTVSKTVNLIKGRSDAQTGTLTAADFFPEGAPEGAVISVLSESENMTMLDGGLKLDSTNQLTYTSRTYIVNADDQKCTVTISSDNYHDITATLIFHLTDKETVTISGLTYTGKTYDGKAMKPVGTLQVSGDKVPVSELEVTYTGIGDTTYNGTDAPTDAGTYQVTYKVREDNDNYIGEKTYTFTISPKAVTADMIGAMADETYTGSPITPQPVVMDGNTILTSGTDFDFSYDENINAGENTATLTITGKGNYTGTASRTFTISPKDIKGAAITLQADSLGYTGLMQEVQITSVTLNQVPLTTNDYYIVNNSNEQISADASITLTIAGKGNYTGTATTTWKITRATPALDNFDVTPDLSQKQTYDGKPKEVTAQPKNGVIGMGAVTVCYEGSNGTTYPRSKTAPTNAGTYQVILSVAEGKNYTAAEIEAGTLTIEKADLTVEDVTEFFEYTKKGEQTINLAELVPGARSYTPDAYTNDNGIVSGDITIDATGLMKFALSELTKDNIDKKVTVPVIITSENYKDVTVKVTIYISPEYRIIDGANSSWTQNTDGTVVIRGNGEFSRFHAVKVDGKVIDPANYEAKEGSTIITLKAEYLKTLATGSHTFAIVWDNGIAGTNFTVAANTSGNNSGNNSNNNDSNHGSHNSGNNDSGNTAGTAANTAGNQPPQELDKVPATGDASGIWLALFAVSLSGWAVMMVLKRKPGQKGDPK
ncbi:MAG: MBG domain-containing protein [Waltera sp.]